MSSRTSSSSPQGHTPPNHVVLVAPAEGDGRASVSTIVIAQGLRYWLLAAWALSLGVCCGPSVALGWFAGCCVLGLVRGRVERALTRSARVSVGAELTVIATLTSAAWALAPLWAWRTHGPWSLAATITFLFAGVLLVATQFRHLPRRALIVATPYLAVLAYVLATARSEPGRWALLAAVGVAGSAILTKAFFGRVHKAQIDAFQAEQARLIAALEIARDEATAASDAKSAFMAVISHELRTPMNGVLGAAQLLRNGALDEPAQELVAVIDEQGRTLACLLDDILDFARIEAGKLEVSLVDVELAPLVRRIAALWTPRAQEKGLALDVTFAPQAPEALLCDPIRLSQMLHNLLSNAVKFTDAGAVNVHVEAAQSPGSERLRITVADTGPGVTAAGQARLFQAFSQVDSSSTRRHGGAGLGLAISRRVAGLLGGDLHLEPSQAGARFVIDLPLVRCAAPQILSEPEAPDADSPARRVLVVEDHPANQRILAAWLEGLGHLCVVAENGAEGLAAVRQGGFDLVLMDVNMPVMDGLEAVRAIRLEGFCVPIVMLSASAGETDRATGLQAGADGYMAKPVQFAALHAVMSRLGSHVRVPEVGAA
ncbi:response regulator [Caulobacter radicis]|uniref:histidine kinase n=1 Tax=Caulobacter radicis TaxID=2172650 RepID=A0A2T9IVS7_9CAUL|nr:response regulator [Caulobacter radicis]PVM70966.1 hybrid sensor histidine kinase/response regulator [Caulobacter radicis]PVM87693.1 hybrid sensor histidine kinase/response regulator [Caulobacter radicis]